MEAIDTVLSRDEQFKLSPEGARERLCIRQAEVSFKAGYEKGVEFLDLTSETQYKAGYEEGRLYGKRESLLNQAIINQQVKNAYQAGQQQGQEDGVYAGRKEIERMGDNSVTPDQFWQKATDFYDIHHSKYRRAILTEEELRETVTDYTGDMMNLMSEWYNSQGNNGKEKLNNDNKTND